LSILDIENEFDKGFSSFVKNIKAFIVRCDELGIPIYSITSLKINGEKKKPEILTRD